MANQSSVGPQAQYTVTFNDGNDGNDGIYRISVDPGKTVPLQPIPQKDNSRFLGWYNGTLPYDFTQPVNSHLTLTGKWADTKFTLDPMRSPVEGGKLLTLTPPTIPATQFQQITAGRYHMLALDTLGRVYAWGRNDAGQIGDGTTTDRAKPTLVTSLLSKRITKVVAGPNDSFAFAEDGSVYAWGANEKGQLGVGSSNDLSTPTPVNSMPTGARITDIFPGDKYTLALDSDGVAWAWGMNDAGQLGNGNATDQTTPVRIQLPPGVSQYVSLSAGTSHSFGITDDGNTYAWGWNGMQQLGNASFPSNRGSVSTTPIKVDLPPGVSYLSEVFAIADWSVAIGNDGRIYGWGYNGDNEIGDGTTAPPTPIPNRNTPTLTQTPPGETFDHIYTMGDGAAALSKSGNIYSWGYNPYGGVCGGTQPQQATPIQMNLPANVHPNKVTFGWEQTVMQDTEGRIWSWGSNRFGQLGTDAPMGAGQSSATPVQIPTGQEKVNVTQLTIDTIPVTLTPVADHWQLESPPHDEGETNVTITWTLSGEQQDDSIIEHFIYESFYMPDAGALPVRRRLGGSLLVLSLFAALACTLYQLARARRSSSCPPQSV
ncbi:hypothetical protein KIM372_14290 [Bombiscardovia nodaiensis]|uniref:RCC1-like domain-containing protein n=1 Tax=Bombiscardovia nodaiensis TaxID=2932181 RepID=A0ABM8B9E9_9BIFI|nr:hypothetical protein KIM372_14290 [Bombiscardovia nodaiensis]